MALPETHVAGFLQLRIIPAKITATWASATKPDRTDIANPREFAHKCHSARA